MKRMIRHYALAAILLIAGLSFPACTSIELEEEKEVVNNTYNTYTITVQVKNDGALTKGLSKDKDTGALIPEWNVGDEVLVVENNTELGTLKAQSSTKKSGGSSIEFSGELTMADAPKTDEVLTLYYHTGDYTKQDGTYEGIGQTCDFAVADVKITNVEGSNITTSEAKFKSQQAIVEFNLLAQDEKGIKAKKMTITYGDGAAKKQIFVNLDEANNDVYVAIQMEEEKPFHMEVEDENGYAFQYTTKENVSFVNGKYYRINVTMKQDLALGLAYYNDNSFGRNKHTANAKPVGIIVYLGSEAVAGSGRKGLVMALKNLSGTYTWGNKTDAVVNAQQVTKPDQTSNDLDGMANTISMSTNASSAAAAAVLAMEKIENTSGWFIPSSGQWLAMLEDGLGQADPRSTWKNGEGKKWTGLQNVVLFKDNKGGKSVIDIFNEMMELSGVSSKDEIDAINVDQNFWLSSEYNNNKGIRTNLGIRDGYTTFKMAGDRDKTYNKGDMFIRPFFAF